MRKSILLLLFLMIGYFNLAQDNEEKNKNKALKTSKNLTWQANKMLSEDKFIEAEVDYRKAIAKSTENIAAPFNLGNAYYQRETYNEAFVRFKEAAEYATDKKSKHKAYHNIGNVFMKRKEYEKAVETYKEALRNNPTDEETRYNLALAKELLKKQQDDNKNKNEDQDQDKKEEDKDKKDENKDKEDKKEGEDDKKEEGDEGKNNEKEDDSDKGKEDKKKDEDENDKKPQENNQNSPKQPRPNQLSKQQVQNLLEAMQNEEKKVKEKIDAKKVQGNKVKTEKDW